MRLSAAQLLVFLRKWGQHLAWPSALGWSDIHGSAKCRQSLDLTSTSAPSLSLTFEDRRAAVQRMPSVGVAKRTHAERHEAARNRGRRWPECLLEGVLQPLGFREQFGATPTAAF